MIFAWRNLHFTHVNSHQQPILKQQSSVNDKNSTSSQKSNFSDDRMGFV